MIVLSWQANWKRTTKLLCQHFRLQRYMMRLSDPFYSCIKLRLTVAEHYLQLNDLCTKKYPACFCETKFYEILSEARS